MNKVFQIGEFVFRLVTAPQITPPPNFMLFEADGADPVYTYDIQIAEVFPHAFGRQTAAREDLLVYEENGFETRYIGVKGTAGYYACYREVSDREAHITLNPARLTSLNIDPVFSSLLALERRQIDFRAIVLHCAYVEYEGEAILFSAPSETGKTTQANLWEKYRGARSVNGDRALLQKKDGRWMACGWPVCGSSEVCHNEEIPIRSIVMLSQGKADVVSSLTPIHAFSQVYSQVTANRWNRTAHAKVMDLVEELVTEVPIWHLSCTISREAVDCLHRTLFGEEG